MSAGARRWWWLAASVLAVAAALWSSRAPIRERPDGQPAAAAGVGPSKGHPQGPAARGGVAARDVTVAADGWVRGRVVDEDGGAVDEGRLVLWCLDREDRVARIEGGTLALDAEGAFAGPACRGRVCVELHHASRVPAESWVVRPGVESTLETRLLPRLVGRVVDPEGRPVPGATVGFVLPPDEDDPGAMLAVMASHTTSDADGEFSVARLERPPCDPCQAARDACSEGSLPVGDRVLVTARAPGWAPGSVVVELDGAGHADAPLDVVLRPASEAITGTLLDAAGHPLPRAIVLARSEVPPHEQHQVEASGGAFALEGLAEGSYTVRAIQDARELWQREGVEPGATLALELPWVARDVSLELVDADGRPQADVQVEGGPFGRQRAGMDGRVRAQRVAPGPYILRIRPSGGGIRAYDLEIPEGDAEGPEISLRLELGAEG